MPKLVELALSYNYDTRLLTATATSKEFLPTLPARVVTGEHTETVTIAGGLDDDAVQKLQTGIRRAIVALRGELTGFELAAQHLDKAAELIAAEEPEV